jgi:2-C-methyl-D-erythritol 2,4-cyclodiphosphate synthase
VRIGQGIDIHRFSEDPHRPLILGGVVIEGARGLGGHSDADAVSHALADAILGAVGLGDLGRHFPDTDPVWEGADSVALLTEVVRMAAAEGFGCANADCTVVADTPRLSPHTAAMAARLGAVLGAPVSVKATRAEGIGALGRAEGIACLAVVLMEPTRENPA